MYCKRCENEIPDNSVRCPACGFPIRTVRSKQHRRVVRTIIATDVLTIVMSIINAVLLVSGAHYATDLYNGGWFAVRMAYFSQSNMHYLRKKGGVFLWIKLGLIGKHSLPKKRKSNYI